MVQLNTGSPLRKSSSGEDFNNNTLITPERGSRVETTGVTEETQFSSKPEELQRSPSIVSSAESSEDSSIAGGMAVQINSTEEEENSKPINEIENTITIIQGLRNKIEQNSLDLDIEKECLELINLLHQKTGEELSIIEKFYKQKNANLIKQIEFILPFLSEHMHSWEGDILDHDLVIPYLQGFWTTDDDMFEKVEPYIFYYAKVSYKLLHPIGVLEKLIKLFQLEKLETTDNFKKISILGAQIVLRLIDLIKTFDKSRRKEKSLNIKAALIYWFMTPFSISKDIQYPILSLFVMSPSLKNNIALFINEENWSFERNIINDDQFICLFIKKIKSTYNASSGTWTNIFAALKMLGFDPNIKIFQHFTLLHLAIQFFKDVDLARYLLIECKLDSFQKTTLKKADLSEPDAIDWSFATACKDIDSFIEEETPETKKAFQKLWEEYEKEYLLKRESVSTEQTNNIPRSKRRQKCMSHDERLSIIKAKQKQDTVKELKDSAKVKNVIPNKPKAGVKPSQPYTYSYAIFNPEVSFNIEARQNSKQHEQKLNKKGKTLTSISVQEEQQPVIAAVDLQAPFENQKKHPISALSALLEANNPKYKPSGGTRKTFEMLDENKEKIPVKDLQNSIYQTAQSVKSSRTKGSHNTTKTKQGNEVIVSTIPGALKDNPKKIYKKNTAEDIRTNLITQLAAVGISENDLTVSLENLTPRHLRKLKSQNNEYFSFKGFESQKKESEPDLNPSPADSPPAESKDESSEEEGLYDS